MVTMEMLETLDYLDSTEERETQAPLESRVPRAFWVNKDQRVKEEILEIQVHRDRRALWEVLANPDKQAKGEGEETLEQREDKVLMG